MGTFGDVEVRGSVTSKKHTSCNMTLISSDFVREVAALVHLRPTLVTTLYSWHREADTGFCVTLYMSASMDLFRYICNESPLTSNQRAGMRRDLLQGLTHIHEMGFIHRDIKPANILIYHEVPLIQCKYCDFGTCVPFVPGRTYTMSIGTLEYAAPEALSKSPGATYDTKVDWYSLGLVFVNLLLWNLDARTIPDSNTKEKRFILSMLSKDPLTRWSPPNRPARMFSFKNTFDPHKEWLGYPELSTRMRTILFDWMDEVNTKLFKFKDERVMTHAKLMVDHYVELCPALHKKDLQKIGCAAMSLSAKLWENIVPEDGDYVYISDDSFTIEEFLEAHMEVLRATGGNLYDHASHV